MTNKVQCPTKKKQMVAGNDCFLQYIVLGPIVNSTSTETKEIPVYSSLAYQ